MCATNGEARTLTIIIQHILHLYYFPVIAAIIRSMLGNPSVVFQVYAPPKFDSGNNPLYVRKPFRGFPSLRATQIYHQRTYISSTICEKVYIYISSTYLLGVNAVAFLQVLVPAVGKSFHHLGRGAGGGGALMIITPSIRSNQPLTNKLSIPTILYVHRRDGEICRIFAGTGVNVTMVNDTVLLGELSILKLLLYYYYCSCYIY